MNIVVTGGAGFIGSHLCEALLSDGHSVAALDNFDDFYDPARKRKNLGELSSNPRFKLIEGDIRNAEDVREAIGPDTEIVVHLAARAGVRPSIEQPLLYQDVNIRGTMVLLEAVRRIEGCKFIFGSSSSVYGNNAKVPFAENDNVDAPISPYAATKRAGELFCRTYCHLYGIPTTCLRFFTVYGPRQRPDLAIHKFARLMETGKPIPVFGDGSMQRDYTYVDDIVRGVQRAIERCSGFATYNLGNASPISLTDLIAALETALGRKAIIERLPLQPGDVNRTFADITLASRELGFKPSTGFAAGLAVFVEWFRKVAR
jgi:UDP-glucuronate 4-epimerase